LTLLNINAECLLELALYSKQGDHAQKEAALGKSIAGKPTRLQAALDEIKRLKQENSLLEKAREDLDSEIEATTRLVHTERDRGREYSVIAQVLTGLILSAGKDAPSITQLRESVGDVFKLLHRDPAKYEDKLLEIVKDGSGIATTLVFKVAEEAPQVDSNTEAIIFIRHKPEAKA
jgi:hypothetical protein